MFILKKIFWGLKASSTKKLFQKNATLGKNFVCASRSFCRNESGKKENISIGNDVSVMGSILLEGNGIIKIGDNTTIRHSSRICAIESIIIGKNVVISNNVVIMDNNSHPVDVDARLKMSFTRPGTELWRARYSAHSPIVIDDAVWVGEGASILKGVHIGFGSVVATKAVVTHDVPPLSVVAGNPAKVVKFLNKG